MKARSWQNQDPDASWSQLLIAMAEHAAALSLQ